MSHSSRHRLPPIGLGLASVVLGAIGLMLFVLPVLAAPVSGCGAILGLCGIVASLGRQRTDLQLSTAGVAMCAVSFAIDIAIQYAPGGYLGRPADSQIIEPGVKRPYVPPPAPFRGQFVAKTNWRAV
jgi:hypothetical protein